jgi:hypothetical protein
MLFLWLGWANFALADVSVSFPAQGYYRPGKYFPVLVRAGGEAGTIEIRAQGAAPIRVAAGSDGEVIVPMLAVGSSLRGTQWIGPDGAEHLLPVELRTLAERDVLVGAVGAEPELVQSLFSGRKIIALPVDSGGGSLLRPAVAWQILNAVILSPAAAAQLSDYQLQSLLAGGTAIVVRSNDMPDSRWPWKREGAVYVLRHEISGPSEIEDAEIYEPMSWRDPGWPASFRGWLLAGACVFCIAGLGISLWKSRFSVVALLVLMGAAGVAVVLVYFRHSPVQVERLCVAVRTPEMIQLDFWSWHTTVRQTNVEFPAPATTCPVFGSLSQLEQTQIWLICDADGRSNRFAFHLGPQQRLAMLTRTVRPRMQLNSLAPPEPKWRDFVQTNYLRPTDTIVGRTFIADPATGQAIAAILIDRR